MGAKILIHSAYRGKGLSTAPGLDWVFVTLEKYEKLGESPDKSNENDERVGR